MDKKTKKIRVDLFNIDKDKDKFNFFRYQIENKEGNIMLLDRIGRTYRRILYLGKGTLLRGTIKKEEADFFYFPEGKDEIIRLSFFYPEGGVGGIRLDSYSFKIPMKIEKCDYDTLKSSICIAGGNKKEYFMINKEKDIIYKGKIKGEGFKVKVFGDERAFIISEEGVYIVDNGKRGFIEKKSLPFSPLEIESWGKKEESGKEFLVLGTKNKVIMVSLNKENLFYFGVFDRDPFEGKILD